MILIYFTLILSLTTAILAIYNRVEVKKIPVMLEEEAKDLAETIKELMQPMQKKVNQTMSIRAQQGVDARQLKTAEKYVAQDIMAMQDPIIVQGLEMISPRTKEYLEKNPELLLKLLPRFQALMQVEGGFKPMDLLNPGDQSKNRPHPYSREE